MKPLRNQAERRRARVRRAIRLNAVGRPRLSVHRSGKHIYAQVIDDTKGQTLAAASSLEKALRESLKSGANVDAAKGVKEVVFDRGSYLYHGRVKALADAAREGGLSF